MTVEIQQRCIGPCHRMLTRNDDNFRRRVSGVDKRTGKLKHTYSAYCRECIAKYPNLGKADRDLPRVPDR